MAKAMSEKVKLAAKKKKKEEEERKRRGEAELSEEEEDEPAPTMVALLKSTGAANLETPAKKAAKKTGGGQAEDTM
jgi:hypothetical protein